MSKILRTVATYKRVVIVVAISSGQGFNSLGQNMKNFMSLFQLFEPVQFLPFTDKEVKHFIKLEYCASQLKPITDNNPYLLALAVPCTSEKYLIVQVNRNVINFLEKNLEICENSSLREAFLMALEPTEKYFRMASNVDPIPSKILGCATGFLLH